MIVLFRPLLYLIGNELSFNEMMFMSWGGLRGAVSMALALSLSNSIADGKTSLERQSSDTVFFFIGGIAAFTLLFNATTCGPLLRHLLLVDTDLSPEKAVMLSYLKARLRWKVDRLIGELKVEHSKLFKGEQLLQFCSTLSSSLSALEADDDSHQQRQHALGSGPLLGQRQALQLELELGEVESKGGGVSQGQSRPQSQTLHEEKSPLYKREGGDLTESPSLKPEQSGKSTEPEAGEEKTKIRLSTVDEHKEEHEQESHREEAIRDNSGHLDIQPHVMVPFQIQLGQGRGLGRGQGRVSRLRTRTMADSYSDQIFRRIRKVFLQVVHVSYWKQIKAGKLPRHSPAALVLLGAVDRASEWRQLADGLKDWNIIEQSNSFFFSAQNNKAAFEADSDHQPGGPDPSYDHLENQVGEAMEGGASAASVQPITVTRSRGAHNLITFYAQAFGRSRNPAVILGRILHRFRVSQLVHILLGFVEAHEYAQKKIPLYMGATEEADTLEQVLVVKESQNLGEAPSYIIYNSLQ